MRALVKTIESNIPAFHDFLSNAGVEIMRALGTNRRILGDLRLIRRAGKFGDRTLRDCLQRRWREITRIAEMERGSVPWFVNRVDPRAELIFVAKRIHDIEPPTEINREFIKNFPFVLQIESVEITVFIVVIDDALRRLVGDLIAVDVDRKNQRNSIDGGG